MLLLPGPRLQKVGLSEPSILEKGPVKLLLRPLRTPRLPPLLLLTLLRQCDESGSEYTKRSWTAAV